eukprot:1141440-Rhodomonas_salina.1
MGLVVQGAEAHAVPVRSGGSGRLGELSSALSPALLFLSVAWCLFIYPCLRLCLCLCLCLCIYRLLWILCMRMLLPPLTVHAYTYAAMTSYGAYRDLSV